MRAIPHARPHVGGVLVLAALAIPALLPAAAPAAQKQKAKPPAALADVGNPPRTAEAGDTFRLAVKVRNTGKQALRPQVVVRLHKSRGGKGDRIGARRLGSVRAGRSASTRVTAKLPAGLAAGRYYVSACVKVKGKTACRVAGRRIDVSRPAPGPGPNPGPGPGPNPGPGPQPEQPRFDVLVLTETGVVTGQYRDATPAGVEALQALGKEQKFGVTVADESLGHFTAASLDKYRVVIFLNVSGDVLTAQEQSAFQAYYKAGGGFLAIHGAIEAEPNWSYMSDLLGTRATGEPAQVDAATVKVADRVHDASKTLPLRWTVTDTYFNYAQNVRGTAHVLATVDENTYAGGTMGPDHPVAWCKDYQGGRSFYTGIGGTAAAFGNADTREHLAGAIQWAAGKSDPVYSDCGATVLANYQQTKISAPPNLNEPIGFDQLPDGRVLQTARAGQVRLHDPASGESKVIANLPVYTHSEDGLYGPAVDREFATNKWVYLFYSPLRMEGLQEDGVTPYPKQTPQGAASTVPQPSLDAWDEWKGYFQLSRFKFVDGENPTLDLGSEQKIMKVPVERGACCHVGGDIDFDKNNNLWLVTGDDTPAGAGNAAGWGSFNDMTTNEVQTLRTFNASGGTFTLTFDGQTTAPIAWNAAVPAVQAAIDALPNVEPGDLVITNGATNTVSGNNLSIAFRGQYLEEDVPQITTSSAGLTGTTVTPTAPVATSLQGSATLDEVQTVRTAGASNQSAVTGGTWTITFDGQTTAPIAWDATPEDVEAALVALPNIGAGDVMVHGGGNANAGNLTVQFVGALALTDVPEMTTDASALTGAPAAYVTTTAHYGRFQPPWFDARRSSLNTNDLRGKVLRIKVQPDGSYTVPAGNLFDESKDANEETRPEIYAMGFRNPFRIQVDSDGVAYVTDYSPDAQANEGTQLRGPRGTGRLEIVRKPANYGWPICMKPDLPMFKWNFNAAATLGQPWECGNPDQGPPNESRFNDGMGITPALTAPDMWYSFRDPEFGTPCFDGYNTLIAKTCPNLFPELGSGGVGPHGATRYEYDPDNPSTTKFPPYYDDAIFFGEFTRDTLKEIRLDEQNKVFKINNLLNCGAFGGTAQPFECDNPMDMQFGADGAFYLLTYGDGFFAANPDAGMYRWEYVKGQRAPQAVISADVTNGASPLAVQFSSAGSRDPDPQDSLTFAWDFESDGTIDSTDPNAAHVYTQNGVFTAKLTVTDSGGKSDIKTTTITVGNTAPTVQVKTPLDGDFFEWGDTIPYEVVVTDPDETIDCSRLLVTAVLLHDEHGHGGASSTGCTGTLKTEASDASHGGYIATGISATYTDKGANGVPSLSTTAQNVVQVRRQQVEYTQQQSGTNLSAVPDGETDPGGGQVRGSLDDGDYIAINRNVTLANMDKKLAFRFAAAGTAGTARANVEIRLDSPTGPLAHTVTLTSTGNASTFTTQSFDITAFTGSRRVFLVFKPTSGGPAGNFGLLNWVEFSGKGATG